MKTILGVMMIGLVGAGCEFPENKQIEAQYANESKRLDNEARRMELDFEKFLRIVELCEQSLDKGTATNCDFGGLR